jgi:hypothetical protein
MTLAAARAPARWLTPTSLSGFTPGLSGWAVAVTTVVCVTGLAAVLAADWINAAPRRTECSE